MNSFKINPYKVVLISGFLLSTLSGFSQQITKKQKEREQNKVEIYTSEEKDNLQRLFNDEVKKMKLTEAEESNYYETLVFYTYDISRLDDKDKDFTEEERREKFNTIINKMNAKMKALLTPKQYLMHLENFGKILYSVNQKRNWD